MAIAIELTRGKTALVDNKFSWLAGMNWYAAFQRGRWYAMRTVRKDGKRTAEYLHHHVLPKKEGKDVDHKSGDTLDDRRKNLRYLSRTGNNANRKKSDGLTSQFKGVCWSRSHKKWAAQIQAFKVHYNLGFFFNEFEAAAAYNEAAQKFFGSAARLNVL